MGGRSNGMGHWRAGGSRLAANALFVVVVGDSAWTRPRVSRVAASEGDCICLAGLLATNDKRPRKLAARFLLHVQLFHSDNVTRIMIGRY